MLAVNLLRLYNRKPVYEIIGCKGAPDVCIFGWT